MPARLVDTPAVPTPLDAATRQADRLRLLATLTASDDSLDALAGRALALTTALLGLDAGVLSCIDGDRYTVVARHAAACAEGIAAGTAVPLGTTYCHLMLGGDARAGDAPLVVEHMGASAFADQPCYAAFGLEGYVGVPVLSEGAVWGTLCFTSSAPLPETPSPEDLDFVRVVALWLGGVVDRLRQRDALARQGEHLHAVLEQAPVVLFAVDAEGVFTLHTGSAAGESLVGQSAVERFPGPPAQEDGLRRVLAGEAAAWTVDVAGQYLHVQAAPVRDADGRVAGAIGVGVDVTAHVLADAQVREAEERYRMLSAATVEAILFSENGVVIEANPQAAHLFGHGSLLDVIGRDAQTFVTAASAALVRQQIASESTEPYEVEAVRADGSTFWAEVQARPAQLRGRPVRMTAIRDVSRRKATEMQTRFQASVLGHVSDAVVAVGLDGRVTYWNAGAERLHGLSAAKAVGEPFAALVHYHLPEPLAADAPDDADDDAALLPLPGRTGDLLTTAPDGTVRTVSVSVSDLLDDAGQPAGVLAVARDVTDAREMAARLRHQSLHDRLTGLANRVLFRREVERARRAGQPFAVLFVDLDRFKGVNDTLGHAAGDHLLTTVAERMRSTVDGLAGACVARFGGDEFAVLAPGRPAEARRLARRLLDALSAPVRLGTRDVSPSASVGLVASAQPYADAEALLRDADTAMYEAKNAGRGCVAAFRQTMHEAAALRFGLEHSLREAIPAGQLRLEMQPIVDLDTGAVAGFESLVRWEHPEHGRLAPGRFIPLAEELGLVAEIDRWMLAETCRVAGRWPEAPGLLMLSVNCSDQTFLSDGLAAWARETAEAAGLDPSRLALELTERALVETSAARGVLETVHANGLQLCVDDFGAGYSSLGLLHALPVDGLKIDRSFVRAIESSRAARAVVRAVVSLSDELGLRSVAEGIETEAQRALLRAAGCRLGQGYLFSPPVPPEQAQRLMAETPWKV